MNIHQLQVTVMVLLAGYPLMIWAFRRGAASGRVEAEKTFMRGTEIMATRNANLTIEVERSREAADEERAKTARYFAKISDFERERTTWQNSYYEQSIGHGNAQQLMMMTIENLARQLQAKGVRPQIPKVLYTVREEFEANHEMPSRAAMEAIAAVEAAKATAPVVVETPGAVDAQTT